MLNVAHNGQEIAELDRVLSAEDRLNDAFARRKLLAGENGATFRLSITPLALTTGQLTDLERVSRVLFSALEKAVRSTIAQSEYDDRWTHHRDFALVNASKRRYESPLFSARFDFMLDENDKFKLLEFNPSCPASMCFFHYWREMALPAFPAEDFRGELTRFAFDDPHCFPRSLTNVAASFYKRKSPLNIVLANDKAGLTFELPLMVHLLSADGHRVSIQALNELSLCDGKLLDRDGRPVDMIYCKIRPARSGKRGWSRDDMKKYADSLRAYQEDLVCVLNPLPGYTIAEDKAMLAYLNRGDFDHLLTDSERRVIRKNIPDTLTSADLSSPRKRWISIRDRADYLAKPRCGSRGGRIHFGKDSSPDDWSRLISRTSDEEFVFQRLVRGKKQLVAARSNGVAQLVPMTQTISIFMLRGDPMGVWSRVSAGDLHNAHAGGTIQSVVVQ